MPYVSDAQRRFFHSKGAAKAGITHAMVSEYDKASKGKKLPAHHCPSCAQGKGHNGSHMKVQM